MLHSIYRDRTSVYPVDSAVSRFLAARRSGAAVNAPPFKPDVTIALIGLMGAGKTTIGRRLAACLGLPFIDADAEIETAAGC